MCIAVFYVDTFLSFLLDGGWRSKRALRRKCLRWDSPKEERCHKEIRQTQRSRRQRPKTHGQDVNKNRVDVDIVFWCYFWSLGWCCWSVVDCSVLCRILKNEYTYDMMKLNRIGRICVISPKIKWYLFWSFALIDCW